MATTGTAFTLTLGAALAGGWASTLGQAKGDIGLLGSAIAKTRQEQKDLGVPDFEGHKKNTDALAAAKLALQSYQEEAHKSGVMTEEQAGILAHLTKQHEKAEKAYNTSKKAINDRSIALKAEGKDVDALTRKHDALASRLQKQVALGAAWSKFKTSAKDFGKTAAAGIGVITAATAAAYKFVNSTAAEGDALNNTSARLGIAVSSLQELNFAASRSGMEAAKFEAGLDKLGQGLDDAIIKRSGPAHDALQRLGMDARALATMPADERLNAIADALANVGDENTRAALSADLFGKDAGRGFNTMLAGGSKGISASRADARAAGAVWDTKGASEYQNSLTALKTSWASLGRIIGAQLMPAFTRLNKTLGAAITGNGGQVGKAVAAIADVFTNFVPVLGAAANLAASFFGVLGKSPWIVKAAAIAVGVLGLAIGAVKLYGVIIGVIALTKAVWGFTAALVANPAGAVVTLAVALGAAIYFVWKKWDAINAWMDAHPLLGGVISAVFPIIGAIRAIVKVVGYFKENWASITEVVGTVWEALKTIFSWSPLGLVIKAYGAMFKWLENKFGIFTKIGGAISKVKGWFGAGKDSGKDAADAPANPIDTTIPITKGGNKTVNMGGLNMQVTQQPGEDSEAFANRVAGIIEQKQAAMLDGALADPA